MLGSIYLACRRVVYNNVMTKLEDLLLFLIVFISLGFLYLKK